MIKSIIVKRLGGAPSLKKKFLTDFRKTKPVWQNVSTSKDEPAQRNLWPRAHEVSDDGGQRSKGCVLQAGLQAAPQSKKIKFFPLMILIILFGVSIDTLK